MRSIRINPLVLSVLLLPVSSGRAAVYSVAAVGDDSNIGSEAAPWQTIQHAANTMVAGDSVLVQSGTYDERVSTVRGGTMETDRIAFQADGAVTIRGFFVNHPFVTLDGFDITGHSAPSTTTGYVLAGGGGDYFQMLNNTVRDGIHIVRTNMVFSGNTVFTATGGFLAAGFQAGQTIWIGRGSSGAIVNSGGQVIDSVTDDTLTVTGAFVDEGPVAAYVTGSNAYGLVIVGGADNCVVRGNTFSNLSYDAWFVGGASNLFENNTIAASQGWDVMHFMGTDSVFRGNFIHSGDLVVYQNSPDVFENWPTIPYRNILFESNFVHGFVGVLASQKGTLGNMDTLTFRNNVFVDVGRFLPRNPNTTFENNSFLYVAASSSPVNGPAPHPLKFEDYNVENAVIRNNVFVACGQLDRFPEVHGWYEFESPPTNYLASHNFVAGPPPGFEAKTGFDEGLPDLNGGDPGFVNIDDPLGPDGIPFTEDDGLRLLPDSKLRGAGYGGVDLGAYMTAVELPALSVALQLDGRLRIAWPVSADGFELQSAPAATGDWSDVITEPVLEANMNVVTADATDGGRFYRLAR